MKRLGAIVALSLLAAACDTARSGGSTQRWCGVLGRPPSAAVHRPSAAPVPYATAAPACRLDQIHATGAVVGFATGNVDERFTFTNISRSSCLLSGFPAVSALAPGGHRLHLHAIPQPDGTFFGQLAPAAIPPGRHVYLDLATEDVTCSARPAVRLPRPDLSSAGWEAADHPHAADQVLRSLADEWVRASTTNSCRTPAQAGQRRQPARDRLAATDGSCRGHVAVSGDAR